MKDAEIEQKLLEFVFTTDADITPAAIAFFARCPISQATAVLDRLVTDGTLRLDTDELGELSYSYPNRKKLEAHSSRPSTRVARCPFCGEENTAVARRCQHCGEGLGERPGELRSPSRALVPATPTHMVRGHAVNPGVAAVLSFVWPGAGQIYAGRVGAGIGWMMGTLLGYVLLVVPGLILHFFCVLSAIKSARETNQLGGL